MHFCSSNSHPEVMTFENFNKRNSSQLAISYLAVIVWLMQTLLENTVFCLHRVLCIIPANLVVYTSTNMF